MLTITILRQKKVIVNCPFLESSYAPDYLTCKRSCGVNGTIQKHMLNKYCSRSLTEFSGEQKFHNIHKALVKKHSYFIKSFFSITIQRSNEYECSWKPFNTEFESPLSIRPWVLNSCRNISRACILIWYIYWDLRIAQYFSILQIL